MEDHTLKVLEYHRFLDVLAEYAVSRAGQEAVRELRPARSRQQAEERRRLAQDCLHLRRAGSFLPRCRFPDPRELLRRAAPEGAQVEREEFLELRELLRTAGELQTFLRQDACQERPGLVDLELRVDPCAAFLRDLERIFDDEGEIADHATPKLAELRRGIATLQRRLRGRLEQLLGDPGLADALQDQFIDLRNNRYVIPVRREYRSRVRGIVHDQSNSGHTLFIEPDATLGDGNDLATLRLEERDEIRRLLADLADQLRDHRKAIREDFHALREFDTAYAISSWADTRKCHFPIFGRLALRGARHPLLVEQFHKEGRVDQLVPLDFEPDRDRRAVVVTGSNTGGKTIVLKTVGLLTLLAQTGLPIPAESHSCTHFYPQVLADIGDEQSIEQSLSTFSGHLRNIGEVLRIVGGGEEALVLLDELGSGTDPVEGGALGCAVLQALSDGAGLTLATTHLGMVKNFVHEHPAMENASVLFNSETLRPEYVLVVGRPGASHALTIAQRVGVPEPVLEIARGFMSSEHLALEDLLSTIDDKQRRLSEDLDTASRAREKALKERDKLTRELEELRKERRRMLHQAQQEAANLVTNTKKEMERLLSRAKSRSPRDKEVAKELRGQVRVKEERLAKGMGQTAEKPPEPLAADDLKLGLRVWVARLSDHGTIKSLTQDRKRIGVDVGGLTFELPVADLAPAREAAKPAEKPTVTVNKPTRGSRQVPLELNLLGFRAEAAQIELSRYLDDCELAGLDEVRVIHGYGTGALKHAVHEQLDLAGVKGYRLGIPGKDPGGDGCTIVTL